MQGEMDLCVCMLSCSVASDSSWPRGLQPACSSLSMGFSRQEYWRGSPFLLQGSLPAPAIEPRSPAFQTYRLSHQGSLFEVKVIWAGSSSSRDSLKLTSINYWMDNKMMYIFIYSYDGLLFTHKKEWSTDTCNIVEGKHYATWRKPVTNDLIIIWPHLYECAE